MSKKNSITCKVYRKSPEHQEYLKARFPENQEKSYSFEWQGHRWAYRYSSFDDDGEYDLLWRPAPYAKNKITATDSKSKPPLCNIDIKEKIENAFREMDSRISSAEIDLNALVKLAKDATPGPWVANCPIDSPCDPDDSDWKGFVLKGDGYCNPIVQTCGDFKKPLLEDDNVHSMSFFSADEQAIKDAAFIAAANPSVVLELVGRLHELERAVTIPNEIPLSREDWRCVDGAVAWHLIDRYADNWADTGRMMDEWLEANKD